nr:MAG TPA: hypothetical protein [Caudoviricetes sp.]
MNGSHKNLLSILIKSLFYSYLFLILLFLHFE